MLKHVVAVNLNYEEGDPKIAEFFKAAEEMLSPVTQVKKYCHYRVQNPEECGYAYGFILEFDSFEGLTEYSVDPLHLKFTDDYWNDAVKNFIDINYIPMD